MEWHFYDFSELTKWWILVELHTPVLISALPVRSYGKRTLSMKCMTPLEHSTSLVMIFVLSLMYTTPWETKADTSDQGQKITFPLEKLIYKGSFYNQLFKWICVVFYMSNYYISSINLINWIPTNSQAISNKIVINKKPSLPCNVAQKLRLAF